jgi:hypothetical protein
MDKSKIPTFITDDDDQYGSAEDSDETDSYSKPTRPGFDSITKINAVPTHNNGGQTPSLTPTRRPMVIPAVRGSYDDDAQFASSSNRIFSITYVKTLSQSIVAMYIIFCLLIDLPNFLIL